MWHTFGSLHRPDPQFGDTVLGSNYPSGTIYGGIVDRWWVPASDQPGAGNHAVTLWLLWLFGRG